MRHSRTRERQGSELDHERPLEKRGVSDAKRMAVALTERKWIPELILCSTAQRSRETAGLLMEAWCYSGVVLFKEDLYQSDPATYYRELSNQEHPQVDVILIVAHNPEIERFLQQISRESHEMKASTTALIELDIDSWTELNVDTTGKLIDLIRAEDLP